MSRIGKKAIAVPAGVTATLAGSDLTVKGPKGQMALNVADEVECTVDGNVIHVKPRTDSKRARAFWGMQRTLVNNLVNGVTNGFAETLEMVGVGYKAAVAGKTLKLSLGFSHDVEYAIPDGIAIKCPDATTIEISGIDKQLVGQVAAEIRRWRKPEPYKGKGIKYRGEFIFRKEGKKK
jgi:large subunit ribosomal protein L6